jgi:hypothetical protein
MAKAIPLSDYTSSQTRKLRVFTLNATATSSPIDINVKALIGEGSWLMSDRLRLWHSIGGRTRMARLTLRKLDLDDAALVHCHVELDGRVSVLSNSKEAATRFFRDVFLNVPPSFSGARGWKVNGAWTTDKTTVAFFAGSAMGALSWGPTVPAEIQDSLKEAVRNIEKRNWKSCVVMCRRALQTLMEVGYERFFGTKPTGLDLNTVIRRFEVLTPPKIPKHWLNIADAVRNVGNVPGAHPRSIPGYKFTKQDARLAYDNTSAFVTAYFEKIAP